MRFNKKVGIALIILVSLVWVGNIGYYLANILEEPVFFYTYSDGEESELTYVMGNGDNDEIVSIGFPEIMYTEVMVRKYDGDLAKGKYRVNTIRLSSYDDYFSNNVFLDFLEKDEKITEITYTTKNGGRGSCDIGEITLKKRDEVSEEVTTERENIVFGDGGYFDSKEVGRGFIAKEDIVLKGIYGVNFDEFMKNYNISINEVEVANDSFPITLKKGERIDIKINKKSDYPTYKIFLGQLYILAENKDGAKEKLFCDIRDYNAIINFSNSDIKELLKVRGIK